MRGTWSPAGRVVRSVVICPRNAVLGLRHRGRDLGGGRQHVRGGYCRSWGAVSLWTVVCLGFLSHGVSGSAALLSGADT